MRGSLKRRCRPKGQTRCSHKGECRWSVILDLGMERDPKRPDRLKRKQKWITFRGTKEEAETRHRELVRSAKRNEFVEPSKTTLAEWLREWVEKAVKPPRLAQATYDSYTRIIEIHIVPAIGSLRLQALKPLDVEDYYTGQAKLAETTIQVHHAVLHGALEAAVKANLVTRNVAARASNKPKKATSEDVLDHVWTAVEASAFLKTAKTAGDQPAAFYATALDSGARKGELAALRWTDLDFATGRLTITRQLLKGGRTPVYGPPKTKAGRRTIDLAKETLDLLRVHKAHQAEIKMKNRQHYRDEGLIFAKEWGDLHGRADTLGGPLQVNNIGQREYDRLIKAAGVKRIKFHGLRHTCATLLLAAGVQANVVQRRLGHAKVSMTLDIYAHVLPAQQQDAAARLGALLHG